MGDFEDVVAERFVDRGAAWIGLRGIEVLRSGIISAYFGNTGLTKTKHYIFYGRAESI